MFDDAAENFETQKRWGLGVLIVLSIVVGCASIWWISVDPTPPNDQGWATALQFTAGKLFVFGIMSYLVLMAGERIGRLRTTRS